MSGKYGYWVDLEGIKFSEDDGGSWIQAFPEGTYNHPLFGEMEFNAERLKRFARSVKTNVRGTQLDIDYDHKMFTGKAAGWVTAAEYREGEGLHLNVQWTPEARQAIMNKEYKYFSPEFMDEWVHPKTGKTFKDVLNGGALTNRPFLKDILPVNLSELMLHEQHEEPAPKPSREGDLMDPKELRKALGLAEDASDAEVTAKLNELRGLQAALSTLPSPNPSHFPPEPKKDDPKPEDDPKPTPQTVEEALASLGALSENHPAVKMLTGLLEEQRAQIVAQRKILQEQKVDRMLEELDRGKKFAVPPAVKEQLRTILLNSEGELGQKVYDTYKQTLDLGVVDLEEHGWQRRGEAVDASTALNAEVRKLQEADKQLSYRDAYAEVCRQRPDLAQAVRQDSYIKDGV